MIPEQVLLIDVPGDIAVALARAGIAATDAVDPTQAALAIVGPTIDGRLWSLRETAPALPVLGLDDVPGADALTSADEAVRAVQAWLVDGMVAALERLGGVFGRDTVAGLALGLAALLAETDPDAMRAHRIAGLAGTLGLTALNRPWLAVSEGDASALPSARRAAARARVAIARFASGADGSRASEGGRA